MNKHCHIIACSPVTGPGTPLMVQTTAAGSASVHTDSSLLNPLGRSVPLHPTVEVAEQALKLSPSRPISSGLSAVLVLNCAVADALSQQPASVCCAANTVTLNSCSGHGSYLWWRQRALNEMLPLSAARGTRMPATCGSRSQRRALASAHEHHRHASQGLGGMHVVQHEGHLAMPPTSHPTYTRWWINAGHCACQSSSCRPPTARSAKPQSLPEPQCMLGACLSAEPGSPARPCDTS